MQEAKDKCDKEGEKKQENVPVFAHTHIYDFISS